MKTRFFVWISYFIIFPAISVAADKQITVVGIKDAVNSEISYIVLKEAYQKLGMELIYKPLPGARALHTSNSGEVDGELFRIVNIQKEYTNLIPVPTPINVLQGIVFSKEKDFVVNGWNSLEPFKIGIQIGIKFVERGAIGMNTIAVDTNEQVFKMLDSGRVDIAVVAFTNGVKTLRKLNLTNIRALSPAVQEYPLYHYLHIKNKHLIPKLDAILKEMDASGRISKIRKDVIIKLIK